MKLKIYDWKDRFETEEEVKKYLEASIKGDDWFDHPGQEFKEHQHPYNKELFCIQGSIKFTVNGQEFELKSGNALHLPEYTIHSAIVGEDGVRCIEIHSPV